MKKSIIAGMVGISITTHAAGIYEGGIVILNYQAPYNPVVWEFSTPAQSVPVRSNEGVTLALWYGEGTLEADGLAANVPMQWNTFSEQAGYAGFYLPKNLALPDWEPGDTYTFQLRASGESIFGTVDQQRSSSITWTEKENILNIAGHPPGLPGLSSYSIGFTVYLIPEPSATSLLGIGIAMALKRRRS